MSDKVRILSIDGGGIRGIIPATIIEYVETKLKEHSGNDNARIADFFDMIVGTSTGGILSCFYLIPNPAQSESGPEKNKTISSSEYPASEALKFYSEKGGMIFNQSKKCGWFGLRQMFNATRFKENNIEQIFKEEFGDLEISKLLKLCIITTYDMVNKTAVFFNSRETKPNRKYRVRDIVRSTSAAPTYFAPAYITNLANGKQMINLDGGVFANNPSMCAYVEARKTDFGKINKPSAKDMIILSLGTGGGNLNLPNIKKSRRWGVIKWAKSIPDIMMDGASDTVHYQMKAIYDTMKDTSTKQQYKRIDVPKEQRKKYSRDMSDASKTNIDNLKFVGKKTLEFANNKIDGELKLDEFIKLLL